MLRIDVLILLQQPFDPDQYTGQSGLDQLVAIHAMAKLLRAEYDTLAMPVPEWLDDRLRAVGREIEVKKREALELRLRQIAARKTQLRTRDEERVDLEKEEDRLRELLAGAKQ